MGNLLENVAWVTTGEKRWNKERAEKSEQRTGVSEIRQRGDRCWRGRDRWGSKGGQLDVWNLMRAENWKEDRRDINVEEREEGERGDGITVEMKQMEDKNKMVGCRRRRKQRAVFKQRWVETQG